MKLLSIEIQGVGSYKNYVKVPLHDGLTGIVGSYDEDPLKSVGCGKSTLIMLVLFSYFGKGEFSTLDEIYNDQLDKNDHAFVRVTGLKNNAIYVVERGRSGGASYLNITENETPIGGSSIDSRQKKLIEVLGMDYDMFTASIFFEQDKLNKLADPDVSDSAERRNYVDKILNLKIWRNLSENVTKDINSIDNQLIPLKETIKNTEQTLGQYELQLHNLPEEDQKLKFYEQEKLKVENEIKALDLIKKQTEIIDQKIKHVQLLKNTLDASNQSKLSLEKNIKENKESALEQDREKYQTSLIALDEIVCDTGDSDAVKKDLSDQLTEVMLQLNTCQNDIKHYSLSLEGLKEGNCDKCLQPVTEEYSKKMIEDIKSKIDQETAIQVQLSNKKDKLSLDIESITKEIDKLKELEKDIISKKASYSKEIQTITEKIATRDKNTAEFEKKLKEVEVTISEQALAYAKELAELEKIQALDKKDIDETKYNSLVEQEKDIESKIKDQYEKLGSLKQIQVEKQKQEDILIECKNKYSSLEESMLCKQSVKQIFQVIPAILFKQSVTTIEKESTKIVQQFIPTMKIFIYENETKKARPLEISYEIHGRKKSYKRLSGGQRSLANLALRLGFSKLISMRAGQFIDFLVLDEPFGFLDQQSRDLIKKLLAHLPSWFKQVFVISHVDNVTDFPQLIHVKMDTNGVSRVEA